MKGALDVIRKEAWPFYRTSSGVRLCWELEEPKGPNGMERKMERGMARGMEREMERGMESLYYHTRLATIHNTLSQTFRRARWAPAPTP